MKTRLLILVLLTVTACGSSSKSSDTAPKPSGGAPKGDGDIAAATAAIQGLWTLACTPNDDTGIDSAKAQSSRYQIAGGLTFEDDFFTDLDCKEPLLKLVMTASYQVGAAVAAPAGAHALDMTEVSVATTPQGGKAVKGPCDTKAVATPSECDGDPTFQIVKVEGNSLYFGEETDSRNAASAEQRPVDLATPGYAKAAP